MNSLSLYKTEGNDPARHLHQAEIRFGRLEGVCGC